MRSKQFYYPLIIIFFISIAYSNTLHSPFVYDDIPSIVKNRPIQIRELSLDKITNIIKNSHARKRPIPNISFALNHLAGGMNPYGYHIVNIAIHMLTAIAVYLLFLELFGLAALPEAYRHRASELAFSVTCLWALNPLQTQAITYVVQRMTSLSTMFYILSFYCYVKARILGHSRVKKPRPALYLLSFLFWFFSITSKEIAFTLPVLILLYEYYFPSKSEKANMKKLVIAGLGIAILVILFVGPYINLSDIQELTKGKHHGQNVGVYKRLLTESRIVFYYASLFFLPAPSRLMLIYHYPVSTSPISPITTIISIISIFILILWSLSKNKIAFISFFILWFFITLSPESTFINIHLIFEHRAYLPSVGLAAIAVFIVYALILRVKIDSRISTAALCIIIALLTFNTHTRNSVWKDEITLYEDNLMKNPNTTIISTNLGIAYDKNGLMDKALEQFDNVNRIAPRNFKGYLNKGVTYTKMGMFKEALVQLNKAVEISKRNYDIYYSKGIVYSKMGLPDKALKEFNTAIKLWPENSNAHLNKGVIYYEKGETDMAIKEFDTAMLNNPGSYKAYYYNGLAYSKKSNYKDALIYFEKATKLDKNRHKVAMSLAFAYYKTGDTQKAIDTLEHALTLNRPKEITATSPYMILGDLYLETGMFSLAESAYQMALEEKPGNSDLIYNLGIINHINLKRPLEAKKYFKLFLEKADTSSYEHQKKTAANYLKQYSPPTR